MRLINFNSNIIINLQEPRWNSSAISMTRKVLNACRLQKYGVSIILSNDKQVQYLNYKWKGRNKPTNVLSFSKLLNQKATHTPSAQHVLDEEYYKRIEAIQFTMSHDDGKKNEDVEKADIVLIGVSRTGKTPTSVYLANRGYKTLNIPLVSEQNIPSVLEKENKNLCVVGLFVEAERLSEVRKTRVNVNTSIDLKIYTDVEKIRAEVENSKKMFKKYNWPSIDVTRRSVEETAASILKIYEIKKNK